MVRAGRRAGLPAVARPLFRASPQERLRLRDVLGDQPPVQRNVEAERQQVRQLEPRVGPLRDEPAQRRRQLVGRLVAVLARRRHRALDNLAEQRRYLRVQLARIAERRLRRLLGAAPGEHLPEHHAQRVDVAAPVDRGAVPGLGRDVAAPPDDDAQVGHRLVDRRARDPEVDQLHVAGERQHDVLRRHVAVDDAEPPEPVRVPERARDLPHHVHRHRDRQRPRAELPHQPPQVHPFDELLRDAELAVDLLDPQRARDVLVLEPRRDLRLPPEPRLLILVVQRPVQPLDHADVGILRLHPQRQLHAPHPARARNADDQVGPELRVLAGFSHGLMAAHRRLLPSGLHDENMQNCGDLAARVRHDVHVRRSDLSVTGDADCLVVLDGDEIQRATSARGADSHSTARSRSSGTIVRDCGVLDVEGCAAEDDPPALTAVHGYAVEGEVAAGRLDTDRC